MPCPARLWGVEGQHPHKAELDNLLGVSCHRSCPPFYSQVRCDTCVGALRGRLRKVD